MISILSNIIVLGIFIKFKELRTPTNAIIINLAVTDIGVSSIGYPMSAASDLHGSWKFGYAGCQVSEILRIKAKRTRLRTCKFKCLYKIKLVLCSIIDMVLLLKTGSGATGKYIL